MLQKIKKSQCGLFFKSAKLLASLLALPDEYFYFKSFSCKENIFLKTLIAFVNECKIS